MDCFISHLVTLREEPQENHLFMGGNHQFHDECSRTPLMQNDSLLPNVDQRTEHLVDYNLNSSHYLSDELTGKVFFGPEHVQSRDCPAFLCPEILLSRKCPGHRLSIIVPYYFLSRIVLHMKFL